MFFCSTVNRIEDFYDCIDTADNCVILVDQCRKLSFKHFFDLLDNIR